MSLSGEIDRAKILAWQDEMIELLEEIHGPFGMLVDIRGLTKFHEDAVPHLAACQKACKRKGLERAATIVNGAHEVARREKVAQSSGVARWEHYFDGLDNPDWESDAMAWILDGK